MSDQDIVKDFLVECYENLDQLDRDLVTLEKEPASQATLGSIFRTIHTIKGTCGFLGFGKLQCVAHVGENLLSKLRDGELALGADMTTGLLSLVDAIREILANIETIGAEGEADYTALLDNLVRLQGGEIEAALAEPELEVELPPPSPPKAEPAAEEPHAADHRAGGVSESTIRVDVGLLDKLMNRVGELVLARNQILQFTATLNDPALLSTAQRLNLITSELQEGVMKTRMQPIDNIWNKFPRVVRDLAVQCGKQVRIDLAGKETELDKTIIEAIKDPLTHLVRNAIDHGIESPDVRRAAGKPAEGCLRLRAFHEGGQVNIELSDDGAGLKLDRIRQKAIERGLISQDQALRLSDRESAQLIFAPGFSTAAKVTNISGRGVGMDVVKTNIEKIGGTVEIRTLPGHGTTINLKIPLTLAIIPALTVTCGGDRFAIPQASLLELVRLDGEQARTGIERLHAAPVYRLRGRLLPIVYLRNELQLDDVGNALRVGNALGGVPPQRASAEGNALRGVPECHRGHSLQEVINIVVLKADDRHFGLVVDAINDTEEIVVKPLGKQLNGIPVYAGATIMGDGKVALILDVLGTARRAGVVAEIRDRTLNEQVPANVEPVAPQQSLLILELGDRRLALPISLVSRLEEIPEACIEKADGREVVQYRGQILRLVRLAELLGVRTDAPLSFTLPVVVYCEQGQCVGLVVDRISDIVESAVEVTHRTASGDLLGSALIQRRVTDVLNLPALLRRAAPELWSDRPTHSGTLA